MKSSTQEILPDIGTEMGGGFYAGQIRIGNQAFALIVAPKFEGEHDEVIWIDDYLDVPDAKSYFDGAANTRALAEAGSELAQWALDLRIGGHDDWYLPAQDELEILYRNLKPTSAKNWCYARSGINLSALEPTYPYTPDLPLQTHAGAFQAGGAQSFEAAWHWSSTQHAAYSGCAWAQDFGGGYQDGNNKDCEFRARAVRRLPL